MTSFCTGGSAGAGFISSVVAQIDCQAELLGSGSWTALSAPGSVLTAVLTGLMTIFVALIGYNLLLGRGITVRGGTLAAVKIGMVLALATSWPAYRTVIYDVVTRGPPELVAEVGLQAGIVGSDGTLTQRLDLVDSTMAQIAVLNSSNIALDPGAVTPPPPFVGFDSFALGGSRILFELTAIAGIGAVRIVTGLMLAFGPFILAFLLFDATWSLVSGWVQIISGAALAAVAVSMALGLQLALLEPWLSEVLIRLASGESLSAEPTQLFVLVGFSTLTTLAALWASFRIASAFTLTAAVRWVTNQRRVEASTAPNPPVMHKRQHAGLAPRDRAAKVAGALVTRMARESAAPTGAHGLGSGRNISFDRTSLASSVFMPAGRVFARPTKSRISARANKRNATQ